MINFKKNIRHLRSLKKMSQQVLSEELGITRSRLSSYEEGRTEPPMQLLIILSDYFRVPIDSLIRHDLSISNETGFIEVANHRVLFPIVINQDADDMIEIVPAKASAGYLNGYSDPEYIERLQHMKLPFVPTGKHRAFPIIGDSMPPLKDGDFVVTKFIESLRELKEGKTYVMLTKDDGIVYKRVFQKQENEGVLTFCSDNKIYNPYDVSVQDILEIWEYVCSITTGSYSEEELNYTSIFSMLREMKIELTELKNNQK